MLRAVHAPTRILAPLLALLAIGVAPELAAQDPKISEARLALRWLLGRYRAPVTCERRDGSQIRVEDAVVVRPVPEEMRGDMVRLTFFGIDVADASRCFNIINSRLQDRRGVLYLTYDSAGVARTDVGMTDFRREVSDGELSYHVTRGRLEIREIGNSEAEPVVLEPKGQDWKLIVRDLPAGDDGFRLLDLMMRAQQNPGPRVRYMEFRLVGPDATEVRGYYAEDAKRWR